MKEKPNKREHFISAVNEIPLSAAIDHININFKTSTVEEMAGKLWISVELFTAYINGEEQAPEDLSPKLLNAYKLRIVRGSVVKTIQPPEPPLPPRE